MKKSFILFLLFCFVSFVLGQSNYQQFLEFYQKNDTIAIEKLLKDWENNNPDAEYYVSCVNYFFNKSKKEVISLDAKMSQKEGFEIKDDKGNSVAYLSSKNLYDEKMLQKTFKCFDEGISRFPDRLDIRFGKVYSLGQIEDYENFTKEIIKTIQYSAKNNNNWFWSENSKYEEGKNGFLSSIQDYNNQIYQTNDDSLLKYMKQINEEVLKYYPNRVENLSNLSIVSLISKNYDEALVYLLKAEELSPHDFIVLNNIAYAYKLKNDNTNALKYYNLVKKYGDEKAKNQAEQELKKLNQQ